MPAADAVGPLRRDSRPDSPSRRRWRSAPARRGCRACGTAGIIPLGGGPGLRSVRWPQPPRCRADRPWRLEGGGLRCPGDWAFRRSRVGSSEVDRRDRVGSAPHRDHRPRRRGPDRTDGSGLRRHACGAATVRARISVRHRVHDRYGTVLVKLADLAGDPAAARRRVRIRTTGAIIALTALAAIAPRIFAFILGSANRWPHASVAVQSPTTNPIVPVVPETHHAAPRQGTANGVPPVAGLPRPPPVGPTSHGPQPSSTTTSRPIIKPDGPDRSVGPMPAARREHRSSSRTAGKTGARRMRRLRDPERSSRHDRNPHRAMPDPLGDVAIDARLFDARSR